LPAPSPEQAGTVEIEFATGGRMRVKSLSTATPPFASNNRSDSISMKFADGVALFSEGNQHHANQFSDFRPRPRLSKVSPKSATQSL
jgi:hypothetical protein